MRQIKKNQMSTIYGGREAEQTKGSETVGGITCNYTDTITKRGNKTIVKTHWEC